MTPEHLNLGERMRMLVLCAHERASATLPVGLSSLASPGLPLCEEQALELVIAGRLSIEIVDCWRDVVDRRSVMTKNAF